MKNNKEYRNFMKSEFNQLNGIITDQQQGKPYPPLQKSCDAEESEVTGLPEVDGKILKKDNIFRCIEERESRRKYNNEELTIEEISFLLWCTQGVKNIIGENYVTKRTVPSAGARHPFETYLAINRVSNLKKGVYRYLPMSHELLYLFSDNNMDRKLTEATMGQKFVGDSACVFIWSCIPYRAEWRYSFCAHGAMMLDAGHICQNLYLGCEAIECGTCAIRAYNQKTIDKFLNLDGEDEFVVYLASTGKYD